MEIDMLDNATLGTVIKVVGVGGAGGNAVQHMINKGVSGVEFIAANTDAQALKQSKAHNVIQIGETGLGAGMKPSVGRQLAEESRGRIEDALRGAHMVFIAAGMGGGTGTGAAPVVAQIAKEQGALTVAVVSKPFSYEGQKCMDIADEGLEALSQHVDSLIIILNEKLEEIYEDDSMMEWLQHADDVLNNAVAGIAEIINVPGHINVDFNDVKTIMGGHGAGDDVHLDLKSDAAHADWFAHIFLAIDNKFLRYGMQQLLIGRNIDRLGRFNNARDVRCADFLVLDRHHAAGIEAANMAAGDPGIDIADLAIGHQLGLFQRALDRFHGGFDVHHHAFFQTLGFSLAQADHFMAPIRQYLGYHRHHFRGADVETDDQVFCVFCHNVSLIFSCFPIRPSCR